MRSLKRSRVTIRPARIPLCLLTIGLVFWCLVVSGCIAQQADLARIQKDLEDQITKLNQEKKALEGEVTQAKEAISESKQLLAQQNTEMKDLFRARAEIKQQIASLRDNDVTKLSGDIEEINFRMGKLQEDLTAQVGESDSGMQRIEAQVKKQGEDLTAQQAQSTALIQQVDKDGASINQKMTEFQTALTAFKDSMGNLGDKFDQEAEQDSQSVRQLQAHLDNNKANIAEISQSLTTLKEAVEQSSTLLGGRLEEHGDHLTQLAERTDGHQGNLQLVETQMQEHATHLQELNQTAFQLREHQEVMGNLLGKRGDHLIQQSGRLDERMTDLESHQTALDQTIETNRQNAARHWDELTSSMTSITAALQKTSGDLETRMNSQEQLMTDLTQQVRGLQLVKQDLENSRSQGQSAIERTDEFQQTLQQVTNRLQDIENYQSGLTSKLDSDVQTINTHLAEVNGAIVSMKDALAQVNQQYSGRIDEQDRQLNHALTSFQAVSGIENTTQANQAHLNQLTETVNKLREVVTTIGTKFGERVDQHEERLAELAKRVNRISAVKRSRKK